jgi:hypothetical protein
MWIFYICALIPVIIGAIVWWIDSKNINWIEWLIGSACAFALAGIMHACAIYGMTDDVETWSGQLTKVSYYPPWTERWIEEHSSTSTDSKGHSHTRYWTTTEYDHHSESWGCDRNFGAYHDDAEISHAEFNDISDKFGGQVADDGEQSYDHGGTCVDGDNRLYSAYDKTAYIVPATTKKSFENKIKAAPTVFSFSTVPTNIMVYAWPQNENWKSSDRLLGTAPILVNRYKWDCMNATLGPKKRVNVIMVGFPDGLGDDYGHYQQAKWIGGKKNDLVICFGGATKTSPPKWVYVFGWTESELVKENLMSALMQHPIDDSVIPLISSEITKNYVIKDWHKFDYIKIEPPTWSYWVYFIVMIVTQVGLYIGFNYYGEENGNPWETSARYKIGKWTE